ncbi:hypothetical protein Tco_1546954, partial [Tanacetum coccineum]
HGGDGGGCMVAAAVGDESEKGVSWWDGADVMGTAVEREAYIAEAERATLHATIRTMGAVEMVLRNRMRDERQTRIEIEHQLALVQEELAHSRISHAQDRVNFKKLEDFMTSQFGYFP